ncbi:organic cation transporter protein-like isoform X2 [Argopecten irradians]|uniref:organic cation transporter protein-like isoform X2 n=1 Tax=Argopecten irradians TaxID=31199 RepID=UPI00371CEFBA
MKTFDDVITSIGEFGMYQKRLYAICVIPQLLTACLTLITVFTLNEHHHRCQIIDDSVNTTIDFPTWHYGDNSSYVVEASKCHISSFNGTGNVTSKTECTAWVYSAEEMSKTPISDFDLVCDNVVLRSHATMAFFGGTLVGVILAGILGDVVGRKPVMSIGVLALTTASMACVWSYNYTMFLVTRFLTGMSTLMVFAPCMVIPIEMVGPSSRVFVGIIIELFWCAGEVILCGLAYFVRDWRILQLTIAVPCTLLLSYIIIVPESPRWLLLVGRRKQAMRILRKIAKVNGTTLTGEVTDVGRVNASLRDVLVILRTPKLVLRWTIISFIWYGRKVMNCGSLVLTGVACLSTILPAQLADDSLSWITITLSMIGKFGVSAAFGNIFIYTSELFPTSSRSFILSSSNIFARVGSLVSPYIADLSLLVDSMFGKALPLIIFGCLGLSAGLISLVLPETLNASLPDTIHDIMSTDTRTVKREWPGYNDRGDTLDIPLQLSTYSKRRSY